MKKVTTIILSLLLLTSALVAQRTEILGAGATFPEPLYSRMFAEYNRLGNHVNYQGIGSGGGINQLIARTVDFAGTDAIVAADVEERSGGTIVHIPTCLGAIVLTYNLDLPNNTPLKFNADIIANIYLGHITNWNDRRIAALNSGVTLPNRPIVVVHRSDGSGSSFILTDFLSKTNSEWNDRVGAGTAVNWPIGIGARGNPGVAATVSQTPGAIGYVELIYALSNNIAYADVQNKSGNFITPTMESVSFAANVNIPPDTKVSITDTDNERGYPISSFTWVILYQNQNYGNRTKQQADALVNMVRWMITDGQKFASELHYAPLPEAASNAAQALLRTVTY